MDQVESVQNQWYNLYLSGKMNTVWLALLLLNLQLLVPFGLSSTTFCSVVCSRNSCNNNDPSPNGCTQCNTNWVKSGSTCVPDAANNYQYFDKSSDLGGSLIVQSYSLSWVCSYQLYAFANAYNTIIVRSWAGIPQAFFQMTVYFGIFTVDVGYNSNSLWNYNNANLFLRFRSGDGQNFINAYPLMGATYATKSNLCYTSNVSEHWNKVTQSYAFSVSNVSLRFYIQTNQTTNNNKWGIKQFIIVYRGCHALCLTCFGSLGSQCYSCVYSALTNSSWLSGTTCSAGCLTNYGYSTNTSFCIKCDPHCTVCFQTATYCSACTTSGVNISYLYTLNSSCLTSCPVTFFANKVGQICDPCNVNCSTCIKNASYCTGCATNFSWYNYACYKPCPANTFQTASNLNCSNCDVYCDLCVGSATLCTLCKTAGPYLSYLYNTTNATGSCLRRCPSGFYTSSWGGVNLCLACDVLCAQCTGNPTPCQQCSPGYYIYGDVCIQTCPAGLFSTNATGSGQCLDCNVVCADMTLSMSFSNSLSSQLYIDLVSSQKLNFTTFDYKNFQTISVSSGNKHYTLDMFDVSYKFLSDNKYRIVLKPKGYVFLYNATFTATTKTSTNTDFSAFGMPFRPATYLQTASLVWFLIQGPPFSAFEANIMNSFATLSQKTNDILAKPYVQEIKKSGLFALLFGGAQITSCSVLSNQIQSQNLYQGVRFWAIFVFFDVPPYEQISNQTKNFFVPSVESRIRNAQQLDSRSQSLLHYQSHSHSQSPQPSGQGRRLFNTDQMYWRFQRTGQTSFFIYDCYVTIFLLVLCWLSILVLWKLCESRWYAKHASKIYSAVHKVHEVSLMYVTMAAVVEFTYFEASSMERWVSAGVCLLFNVYFLAYELFVYYELLRYPLAEIGNAHYDYFVVRYGCFLKNIRYAEYEIHQRWSPAHWFRPYNFHVLSYCKKFAMSAALPLFYSAKYAQMVTLLAIQLLEVLRVWCVWPFVSRGRNWLRLSLEVALALFFLANTIQISLIERIQGDDISGMGRTISLFYGWGWAGFLLCFYFNFAHVTIGVYDFLVGLKVSTRAKMDKARRKYYQQKIKQYQKQNESASKQVVNKWIKLGNLNNEYSGQLAEINIRIEEYQMRMTLGKFQISVRKIRELKMMSPRRHYKKNNTVTTKKYQKQALLDQAQNSSLYRLFYDIYTKYAAYHIKTVVLKTFLNVFQQDFQQGEAIPFLRSKMFQKVQLISYANQSEERELENLLQGFPIPLQSFQNF